jgi:hypothetical protein
MIFEENCLNLDLYDFPESIGFFLLDGIGGIDF